MNGDGRLDIISGCYSVKAQPMRGPVYVLYGKEGGFEEAVALLTDEGKDLVVRDEDNAPMTDRICVEPHAYDWDGDGDFDFVVGNFSGSFLLVKNVGTKQKPQFEGEPTLLRDADGDVLKISGVHGAPFLVDWDGDGDVDLISGSGNGGVQIAENDPGEDGKPRFAKFRQLIAPSGGSRGAICARDTPVLPSGSSRIWVADFNGDGKLDVLVGDRQSRRHPKEGISVAEAKAKQAALDEKTGAVREEMNSLQMQMQNPEVGDEKKAELTTAYKDKSAEWRKLYDSRTAFIDAVSTGHVWVYLRK